jgi:uncharacterized protein
MLPDPIEGPPVDAVATEPVVPEVPVEERREPFWSYADFLLLLGFIAAGFLAMGLIAFVAEASVPTLRKDPMPLALPLQIVFYVVIYLGFVAVFRLRYNEPTLKSLGWRPSQFNPILACICGALLAIALSALSQLLRTPDNNLMDKLVNSWLTFVLFAVTAVLIAPFFEELLFRGFLQPLLSRTFGLVAGVILTSALFGLLHLFQYSLAWQYALIIFLAGAAFGWVRERTGSIVPGTLMHCCFNSVSVIGYLISAHPKFK